jgi:hypothetical protein
MGRLKTVSAYLKWRFIMLSIERLEDRSLPSAVVGIPLADVVAMGPLTLNAYAPPLTAVHAPAHTEASVLSGHGANVSAPVASSPTPLPSQENVTRPTPGRTPPILVRPAPPTAHRQAAGHTPPVPVSPTPSTSHRPGHTPHDTPSILVTPTPQPWQQGTDEDGMVALTPATELDSFFNDTPGVTAWQVSGINLADGSVFFSNEYFMPTISLSISRGFFPAQAGSYKIQIDAIGAVSFSDTMYQDVGDLTLAM